MLKNFDNLFFKELKSYPEESSKVKSRQNIHLKNVNHLTIV